MPMLYSLLIKFSNMSYYLRFYINRNNFLNLVGCGLYVHPKTNAYNKQKRSEMNPTPTYIILKSILSRKLKNDFNPVNQIIL